MNLVAPLLSRHNPLELVVLYFLFAAGVKHAKGLCGCIVAPVASMSTST